MKKILYSFLLLFIPLSTYAVSVEPESIEYKINNDVSLGESVEVTQDEYLGAVATQYLLGDKYFSLKLEGDRNQLQKIYVWDYKQNPVTETPEEIITIRDSYGNTDPFSIVTHPLSSNLNFRPSFSIFGREGNTLYILLSGCVDSWCHTADRYFKVYTIDLSITEKYLIPIYMEGAGGYSTNYYSCYPRLGALLENNKIDFACMYGNQDAAQFSIIPYNSITNRLEIENKRPYDLLTSIPSYDSIYYNRVYGQTNPTVESLNQVLYNETRAIVTVEPSGEDFRYPTYACERQEVFSKKDNSGNWVLDKYIGNPDDTGTLGGVRILGNNLYYYQNTGLYESSWTCIGGTTKYYKKEVREGTYQTTTELPITTNNLFLNFDFSSYFQEYEGFDLVINGTFPDDVDLRYLNKSTSNFDLIDTISGGDTENTTVTEKVGNYIVSLDQTLQVKLESISNFTINSIFLVPTGSKYSEISFSTNEGKTQEREVTIDIVNRNITFNEYKVETNCNLGVYQELIDTTLSFDNESYNGKYICIKSTNTLYPDIITYDSYLIEGIDTTSPLINIDENFSSLYTYTPTLKFSVTDAFLDQVFYKFDDDVTWTLISSPYEINITSENKNGKKVQIKGVDTAKNETILESNIIKIDRTIPILEIIKGIEENPVQEIEVIIKGTDLSPLQLSYSTGSTWVSYTNESSLFFREEGQSNMNLQFRAVDEAGNEKIEEITLGVIDRTRPILLLEDMYKFNTGVVSIPFAFDIEYTLTTSCGTIVDKTISMNLLEGVHTCEIIHTDRAGNKTIKSINIIIDTTIPENNLSGVQTGYNFGTITGTREENSILSVSGATLQDGKVYIDENLPAGEYIIEYWLIDDVGNKSEIKSFIIKKGNGMLILNKPSNTESIKRNTLVTISGYIDKDITSLVSGAATGTLLNGTFTIQVPAQNLIEFTLDGIKSTEHVILSTYVSSGGGGTSKRKDICPNNSDTSGDLYDGICEKKIIEEIVTEVVVPSTDETKEVIYKEEKYVSLLDRVKTLQNLSYTSRSYKNGQYIYKQNKCAITDRVLGDTSSIIEFLDIDTNNTGRIISSFKRNFVVKGVSGTDYFQPKREITRAEYLSILLKAHCIELEEDLVTLPFMDVERDTWEYRVIQTAYNKGIIKGEGNKVRPTESITSIEALAILLRIQEVKVTDWGTWEYKTYNLGTWEDNVINTALFLDIIEEIEISSLSRESTLLKLYELYKRY